MPQTGQIETQSEQQSLPHLRGQSAPRSAGRELALDRREDALDQSAASVESLRECSPHFGAHAVDAPGFLSALGRDHAPRTELAADVPVISLAVEFGVGQPQPDSCSPRSGFYNRGQVRAVVPRTSPGTLRQQKLLIQVRDDDPLQPMPPWQRFLPVMMQATHEEGTDRSWCQTRGVHPDASPPGPFAASAPQSAHGFVDSSVDGYIVQALHEPIRGREVGAPGEPDHLAQLAMFGQMHFRLREGSVFVPHEPEDCQQLWLCELVLAETTAVSRNYRFGDLQSDASEE
jgi:hypothetical protein